MERFIKLSESNMLITNDCPVIIEKYLIYKDSTTNRVFMQIMFKNVSLKNIIGIEVNIDCYDLMQNKLNTITNFMYQDMTVTPNQNYGGDLAVFFEDNSTRIVDVTCTRVVFDDRTIWENKNNEQFKDEPEYSTILSEMDPTLAEQLTNYELRYANILPEYIAKPLNFGKLRRCVCGHYNYDNNNKCLGCNQSVQYWESITDQDFLKARADERMKIEEERNKELEKQRIEYEKQQEELRKEKEAKRKKRRKRFVRIGIPIIILIALITVAIPLTMFYFIPKYHYDKAEQCMKERKFSEAVKEYKKAGDMASSDKIQKANKFIVSEKMGKSIDDLLKNQYKNKDILLVYLFPNSSRNRIYTPLDVDTLHYLKIDLDNFEMDATFDKDGNLYYRAKANLYGFINAQYALDELKQIKNKKQFKDYDKLFKMAQDGVVWNTVGNHLFNGQLADALETLEKLSDKNDTYKAMKKMLSDGVVGAFKNGSKSVYTYFALDENSKSKIALEAVAGAGKYVGIKDKVRTPGVSCDDTKYHIDVNAQWKSPYQKGKKNAVSSWVKKGTIDLAKNKVTQKVATTYNYFGGKHKTVKENGTFTR